MKNKLRSIPLLSLISLIFILLIIVLSFLTGFYFGKQKTQLSQSSQITPSIPISPTQKLTVVDITDGDTLKLSNGKVFRLYGVNAPEKNEKYFKEAVEFTKNLTLNKEISFEQEEKYKEDKFGRLLGYVFVEGKYLNLELVKTGLAKVVLYNKRAKIKYQDELLAAEKEAKEKRMGIWSGQ